MSASPSMARRFAENPIIHAGLDSSLGTNLNGPSLIRVPAWLPKPLGRYYLYFAHHQGQYIRLAYSDRLQGPWRVHGPGALRLEQTCCTGHIASPDVHVDDRRRAMVMYFHGLTPSGQQSFRAVSRDGLAFQADDTVLGPFYFRVFAHEQAHYAIAKTVDAPGGGVLLRSPDGVAAFEPGPDILPRMRHAALLKRGELLHIFYSRGEDCPERILVSRMPLSGHWRDWRPEEPRAVLAPELPYEGADLPLRTSRFGAVHEPVRQLRDPAIFEEDGRVYLAYSAAGETSLCLAELTGLT